MANEGSPFAALRKRPLPRPVVPRREWLARAAFEGGLIALSLIGALALNEWKESRDRQARVRDALAAVRLELQANREELGRVIAVNAKITADIKAAMARGQRYENQLLRRAQVVSTAWDSSRSAAITNDMPFPTLMVLGRAYTLQATYERDIAAFYSTLLSGTLGDVRGDPRSMIGLVNEMDGNARRLSKEYDTALKALASR